MTSDHHCGAGLAAISICESLLLALNEGRMLDRSEISGLLEDAAQAQIVAASESDHPDSHHVAVALIERIMKGRNATRG